MMKYERVFRTLKYKIECGLLPAGSSLPSRADLCVEYGTSEKAIRRALAMLEEKGFIRAAQRKRPVVAAHSDTEDRVTTLAMQRIDSEITNDVLKTGVLLCYPVIKNGISLCEKADLAILHKILTQMQGEKRAEFWQLSKRFLRFFVARNENLLILQTVDSLGLADLKPLRDDLAVQNAYAERLWELLRVIERGGAPDSVRFDDMSLLYGLANGDRPAFEVKADSVVLLGRRQLEKLLPADEIRYSAVYMDLLGLIAAGRYAPGDRLPAHKELQIMYGVSVDTTTKAIEILRDWGIIKTVRGKGIFVEMDLRALKTVVIPPPLVAYHVRRYLDSLELLALTIEGAAVCAADRMTLEQVATAKREMDRLWSEAYTYVRTPAVLLDCITENLGIEALSAIYALLRKNFRIGRSIPALLHPEKTALSGRIHEQCLRALDELAAGKKRSFAEQTARLFRNIHTLVIEECTKLGYFEAAMQVYDGAALWQ